MEPFSAYAMHGRRKRAGLTLGRIMRGGENRWAVTNNNTMPTKLSITSTESIRKGGS